MKYIDWLEEWLTYFVTPAVKERTLERYRRHVKNHIAPQLGEYDMEELSAQVLQRFTAEVVQSGLAVNTVNGIISVLKASLKQAVFLGIAKKQYTDAIVRPKAREKKTESFTKEEQRKIERYIAGSQKDKLFGIVLCLYTGLRIGELLALKWSDIDFAKGILTVSKSCHDRWGSGKYEKVTESPKTASSGREIPIPRPIAAKLKALKKKACFAYVIAGKGEQGVQIRSYQRTFGLLLKKLGIPHKGFHALRHTFATRALEMGMDVKTLSEILGHNNPTVTLKRYAHSMLEHKTEMMNRLGKLMIENST